MIYINRRGSVMTRVEWLAAYLDPVYPIVRRRELDGVRVQASWVGIASEHEPKPPKLYVVIVAQLTNGKSILPEDLRQPRWYATEKATVDAHEALTKNLAIWLRAMKSP